MNPLAIQLTLHGAIVLLIGLLTGIPYGYAITGKQDENTIRAWRVAHSGLSMGGTTMIAISAVISNLKLDPKLESILVWSNVVSGYGFCIALPYGAWVGHRGLSIEGPSQNKVVYAGNMVGAIGSLIGTLLLILGCLKTLYSDERENFLLTNRPFGLLCEEFCMLKFYYNPRSPMARRVWRTLLEKEIPFEPILMRLNGDNLQPEFLAINPFHHVPVIVDDGFRVLESLAILDYLETKYPTPALLPKQTQAFATVRMVQMVSTNELLPKVITLLLENQDSPQFLQAKQHVDEVLKFFTATLGNNSYFGGEHLSLADIIAGTDVSLLPKLGVNFNSYPKLSDWFERLMQRDVWRKTELSAEEFEQFKRVLIKLRKRKLNRENNP